MSSSNVNSQKEKKTERVSGSTSGCQTSSSKYNLNSSSPVPNSEEESPENITSSASLRCPFCYSKILPFYLDEASLIFLCSSSESLPNSSQVCPILITSPSFLRLNNRQNGDYTYLQDRQIEF